MYVLGSDVTPSPSIRKNSLAPVEEVSSVQKENCSEQVDSNLYTLPSRDYSAPQIRYQLEDLVKFGMVYFKTKENNCLELDMIPVNVAEHLQDSNNKPSVLRRWGSTKSYQSPGYRYSRQFWLGDMTAYQDYSIPQNISRGSIFQRNKHTTSQAYNSDDNKENHPQGGKNDIPYSSTTGLMSRQSFSTDYSSSLNNMRGTSTRKNPRISKVNTFF